MAAELGRTPEPDVRDEGWLNPRWSGPDTPCTGPLCCLTVVNCAPWLSASTCLPVARTAAWLLALDEWSDGPCHGSDAVEDGVTRYLTVVEGAAPDSADPPAVSLDTRDPPAQGGRGSTHVPPREPRSARTGSAPRPPKRGRRRP
ncbi:hypothetical protein J2S55_007089 [Streptosporangium brasiliense]|uniref:Uncharacterized protein n=1 Tax=Streptosporangium brasiliense TaxID=47480 RepID=A0ABT9REW8_9ACTN|nr:hypothetical protein [Streptosporangium brasiliense]